MRWKTIRMSRGTGLKLTTMRPSWNMSKTPTSSELDKHIPIYTYIEKVRS